MSKYISGNRTLMILTLSTTRRFIILAGLLQAGLLVMDLLVGLATGTYLSALLPQASWSLPFIIQGVGAGSGTAHGLFFLGAAVWLTATLAFIVNPGQAWWLMLGVALFGCWYAPFGMWLGLLQIVLLSAYRLIEQRV